MGHLQNLPYSEDRLPLTGTTGGSPVNILNGQDTRSPSIVVLQLPIMSLPVLFASGNGNGPWPAAKRPMTKWKRPMTRRYEPHEQNSPFSDFGFLVSGFGLMVSGLTRNSKLFTFTLHLKHSPEILLYRLADSPVFPKRFPCIGKRVLLYPKWIGLYWQLKGAATDDNI